MYEWFFLVNFCCYILVHLLNTNNQYRIWQFIDTIYTCTCDLFTNVAGDTILQFLKEINLYTKI